MLYIYLSPDANVHRERYSFPDRVNYSLRVFVMMSYSTLYIKFLGFAKVC